MSHCLVYKAAPHLLREKEVFPHAEWPNCVMTMSHDEQGASPAQKRHDSMSEFNHSGPVIFRKSLARLWCCTSIFPEFLGLYLIFTNNYNNNCLWNVYIFNLLLKIPVVLIYVAECIQPFSVFVQCLLFKSRPVFLFFKSVLRLRRSFDRCSTAACDTNETHRLRATTHVSFPAKVYKQTLTANLSLQAN